MEYILKASAVIFIFYLLYKLFLQRETFFQANRWFLLIGIVTAICIPFVVIPIYVEYTPIIIENTAPISASIQEQGINTNSDINISELLFMIYGLGAALFLGKLMVELTSLNFLFKRHKYYKRESYLFIETENNIPPFSFFNWIVYNPKKYSEEELQHILNHEKAHARELHSIDIIFTQLACVLFWFNPFIWLYKKEIEQNLEFIADKKAQNFSACEKSYQLVLLKSSVPKHKFLITNNFYNSQIKKRIIMLHKSKSSRLNFWKYVLILPALALFLMSFNTKKIFVEADNIEDLSDIPQAEAAAQLNSFYDAIDTQNKNKEEAKPEKKVKNNQTTIRSIAQTQSKATNNSNIREDISITVINKNTTDSELDKIKEDLKKEGLTVKFKGIKRNDKGEITAIKIEAKSKNSNASYNVNSDEVIDAIKIIYDDENNSISIGNGHAKHGKNTFVYETHDGGKYKIHKSGNSSNVYVISDDEHEHDDEHEAKIVVRSNGKKGKVKTIKRSKNVQVISGDDDKVIEIIVDEDDDHDKETIIVNGKKVKVVEGKENIVVKGYKKNVWVTDTDDEDNTFVIELDDSKKNIFISDDNGKSPLYIIDGKEVSKDKIQNIDPDKIESVTVLKDKNAIEKYGKKAKDGVIIIKTKN